MKRILVTLSLLPVILFGACTANSTPPPPTPHPTVIVITATGPYFAAFDDPGDWLIGTSETSEGKLVDGRYVLTIKKPQMLAWANQTRTFGDGIYEVDAALGSGPEASGFGMLLMGATDLSSFFYVMITGDGRYDVGYCQDNCQIEKSLIDGYKLNQSILTENQSNHLRIELSGGQLTLLVNGAVVSQVQGLIYTSGVIGLIGESSQYGGLEATFDNLSVVETHPSAPAETPAPTP
jgi:hypothetical protein